MLFRYRLLTSVLIIIVFMVIGGLGSGVAWMENSLLEAYSRSNLIRLHVIANSDDSAQDQAIKLKVRDRFIQVTEPLLIKVEDPTLAKTILSHNLELLKQTAQEELDRNGQSMPVSISLGEFNFPERIYPFGVLPAGEYQRLTGSARKWRR